MEVLERFEDSIIALIAIEKLHDHEKINQTYLDKLTQEIKKDRELRYPLIVDRYSYVVLDGHHRFFALKRLGCKRAPAIVVDYYDPDIKIETWHPVVKTKAEVKAVFKCLGAAGFFTERVKNEKVLNVLVNSGQACIGMIVEEEQEKYFIARSDDDSKTFKDAMECIRNGLKTEGFRQDLDYVGDDREVENLLKSRKASMVIVVPKLTKEKVVEGGVSGDTFPPKTTRHIIPEKRRYPVSLSQLMKPPGEESI